MMKREPVLADLAEKIWKLNSLATTVEEGKYVLKDHEEIHIGKLKTLQRFLNEYIQKILDYEKVLSIHPPYVWASYKRHNALNIAEYVLLKKKKLEYKEYFKKHPKWIKKIPKVKLKVVTEEEIKNEQKDFIPEAERIKPGRDFTGFRTGEETIVSGLGKLY